MMMHSSLTRLYSILNRNCVLNAGKFHLYHELTAPICQRHQSTRAASEDNFKSLRLTPNLVDSLQHNVNWFNQNYDRVFGIAEIRDMQCKVLEIESEFVEMTQKRKACQDKIEHFKEEIKGIRDKLELTPRQSDNYLKLITQEHNLLREQLSLDVQLTQFKQQEQLLLDNLSKLLRQSHELERLRQERAKYWQIISISLSLAGSLVALIAQRARSQKSVMNQLATFDAKLQEIDQSIRTIQKDAELQHEFNLQKLDKISASLDDIAIGLAFKDVNHQPQSKCWFDWIPSLAFLKSLTFGYYT